MVIISSTSCSMPKMPHFLVVALHSGLFEWLSNVYLCLPYDCRTMCLKYHIVKTNTQRGKTQSKNAGLLASSCFFFFFSFFRVDLCVVVESCLHMRNDVVFGIFCVWVIWMEYFPPNNAHTLKELEEAERGRGDWPPPHSHFNLHRPLLKGIFWCFTLSLIHPSSIPPSHFR